MTRVKYYKHFNLESTLTTVESNVYKLKFTIVENVFSIIRMKNTANK